MAKKLFEKGNSGRPEGSKNKNSILRGLILDAFEENREKAVGLINAMFDTKADFKWLCQLQASLEPKLDPAPVQETHIHLTTAQALHAVLKSKGVVNRLTPEMETLEANGQSNGNGTVPPDVFRVD